jgi:PAS domain S-box-containing protein
MHSAASQPPSGQWLPDNGLKQLELLFRAIIYQPAEPILIADNDRNYQDASCGAAKLFGLPRDKIIGRRIDDFAEPSFRPEIGHLWRTFLDRGEQQGTFRLVGSNGGVRELESRAKGNVLPVRHVLALRDKSKQLHGAAGAGEDPAWAHDYALYLFDTDGRVVAWYSGAERIYGYQGKEIIGQSISCFYPGEDALGVNLQEELKRAATQGHFGNERWHIKKAAARFWANVLTMALRSESGALQALRESCATSASVTRRKRNCGEAGCSRGNARKSLPLPGLFQASLTILRRRMTQVLAAITDRLCSGDDGRTVTCPWRVQPSRAQLLRQVDRICRVDPTPASLHDPRAR